MRVTVDVVADEVLGHGQEWRQFLLEYPMVMLRFGVIGRELPVVDQLRVALEVENAEGGLCGWWVSPYYWGVSARPPPGYWTKQVRPEDE